MAAHRTSTVLMAVTPTEDTSSQWPPTGRQPSSWRPHLHRIHHHNGRPQDVNRPHGGHTYRRYIITMAAHRTSTVLYAGHTYKGYIITMAAHRTSTVLMAVTPTDDTSSQWPPTGRQPSSWRSHLETIHHHNGRPQDVNRPHGGHTYKGYIITMAAHRTSTVLMAVTPTDDTSSQWPPTGRQPSSWRSYLQTIHHHNVVIIVTAGEDV